MTIMTLERIEELRGWIQGLLLGMIREDEDDENYGAINTILTDYSALISAPQTKAEKPTVTMETIHRWAYEEFIAASNPDADKYTPDNFWVDKLRSIGVIVTDGAGNPEDGKEG